MSTKKQKYFCHDCGIEVKTKKKELVGGRFLGYLDPHGAKYTVVKCDACYAKMPALTKFQQCEVYSRIVGYLRPVQQWNAGKKAEFKDRKNFNANLWQEDQEK